MVTINPSLQATRGTLGNLDGGSAGIGGTDTVRVIPGTGNLATISGSSADLNSGTGTTIVVNVAMANVGSGAGIYARPSNNNTLFSFRSLAAGDGMSISVVGDSIVLSSHTNARFNQLTDAPNSYVGQDGKFVVVDEQNSRLIFQSPPSRIVSSSTPPSNPNPGDSWFSNTTGSLYIYYVENGVGQWVESGT